MRTETHIYRQYEIVITLHMPQWQAAIYPTRAGLPIIDWTLDPIWAANPAVPLIEARRRIDAALSAKAA